MYMYSRLIACWEVFHAFFVAESFFQNHPFRKSLSGMPSVSNSLDADQARQNAQTVCKSYQQTTLVDIVKVGVVFGKKNITVLRDVHLFSHST